jgi:protein-S-isoprenylcysteine O-methyltransferase Ste14
MVPMTARGAIGLRGTPRAPVDTPLRDGAVEVPAGTLKAWRDNPIGLFRLVVFGRLVPATFFAWLGYQQLLRLAVDVRALPRPVTAVALVSGPLPAALYLCFCLIPVGLYARRPAPHHRDGRLVPRALAMTGTLMVLLVGALPPGTLLYRPPLWSSGLSTGISIVAFTVIIYALMHLRSSLSIIPEVRRLVIGGPYRLVRHPLYAAEILAAFAFVLVNPTVSTVLVLAAFVAVQLLRARYEERLLTVAYPLYIEYARRTRRVVPFIW